MVWWVVSCTSSGQLDSWLWVDCVGNENVSTWLRVNHNQPTHPHTHPHTHLYLQIWIVRPSITLMLWRRVTAWHSLRQMRMRDITGYKLYTEQLVNHINLHHPLSLQRPTELKHQTSLTSLKYKEVSCYEETRKTMSWPPNINYQNVSNPNQITIYNTICSMFRITW